MTDYLNPTRIDPCTDRLDRIDVAPGFDSLRPGQKREEAADPAPFDSAFKETYPTAMYLRNIRKDKRVCCRCGNRLGGWGDFMYVAVARGLYFCRECQKKEGK